MLLALAFVTLHSSPRRGFGLDPSVRGIVILRTGHFAATGIAPFLLVIVWWMWCDMIEPP